MISSLVVTIHVNVTNGIDDAVRSQ